MASEIQTPKAVDGSNLKIELPSKTSNCNLFVPKDGSSSDATSCISSADATTSAKGSEIDQESVMAEPYMYYPVNGLYGYYYPGFNGSVTGRDAQNYFVGSDGLEVQQFASQTDNGSAAYYFSGFQPEYNSYNSFPSGAIVNVDGQYLGQQIYYPNSMLCQPFISPGIYPQSVPYGPDLVRAYSWDPSSLVAGGFYGNVNDVHSTFSTPKTNFSSQIHSRVPLKTSLSSRSTTLGKKGSSPTTDKPSNSVIHDQPIKPTNKAASVLPKGVLPVNKLPSYPIHGKSGLLYPHSTGYMKETGRWVGTDKLKARSKTHGIVDFDMLNEQNCGPRTNSLYHADSVGSFGTEGNDNGTSDQLVRKDDYNLPDFPTKYDHALFFIIKSYSEDDIHKSIKYNVWASTPNGNKRLDNAFQLAQEKKAEKGIVCPVFLFFSVNASGQFCGVAEMIGRVNFSKKMDFWQQDKWTGYFPVKWHIIKDIPNSQFRHIILANNENKPVTNSRDTQEVKFHQGSDVLNIFKNYSCTTSILDDFNFYENRQKALKDKTIKPPTLKVEQNTGDKDDVEVIVSGIQSIELAAKGQLSAEVLAKV